MYYSQYNMYKQQWYSGYPATAVQHQYFSCMHEEQSLPTWQHNHFGHPVTPISSTPETCAWEDHASSPIVHHYHGSTEMPEENALQPSLTPPSPLNHRPPPARSPYQWMKKTSYQSQPNPDSMNSQSLEFGRKGKTRTKDKYRVVYSDHQRLELEKEFHYSRYITIRRKAELASALGLSERQVKIWFQNRRAKDRKQVKKREELMQKEKIQPLVML